MSRNLTLKEELEILRGEPIQVFTGDPMDIPCIETSDPEKLCKHPVVSVNMITYNHEPYIRQAIEGVMMQKTDFEFELVIGEDCSTDKTREICFEYQKQYPDKIRVLWSHENITVKHPHPAGLNSTRVTARCRGEFIAYCEGDDYWIDPLKLQKQVMAMRLRPGVALCFTGGEIYWEMDDRWGSWDDSGYVPGFIGRNQMMVYQIFGMDIRRWASDSMHLLTSTAFVRRDAMSRLASCEEIFAYRLSLGDKQMFIGTSSFNGAIFLSDKTSVYHHNSNGAMATIGANVIRDAYVVQLYFSIRKLDMRLCDLPLTMFLEVSRVRRDLVITTGSYCDRIKYFADQCRINNFRYRVLVCACLLVGLIVPGCLAVRMIHRICNVGKRFSYNISSVVRSLYDSIEHAAL